MKIKCNDGFTASLVVVGECVELAYPSTVCSVLEEKRGFDEHCWMLDQPSLHELVSSHGGLVGGDDEWLDELFE